MDRALNAERRRRPRIAAADAGLTARLRPGGAVQLVDVGPGGALVEIQRQLRPGAFVDVLVSSSHRRTALAARVVRCAVAAIHPTTGPLYWAGIRFDEEAPWLASPAERPAAASVELQPCP